MDRYLPQDPREGKNLNKNLPNWYTWDRRANV